MIDVQRVDYIRVPVDDIEAAKHFYGELLGLKLSPNSPHEDWVEYEIGNATLAIHCDPRKRNPPAAMTLTNESVVRAR